MKNISSKKSGVVLPKGPEYPVDPPILCRTIGLNRGQALQIEQPADQESFLPDIAQRSSEESAAKLGDGVNL